jgi:hypothetical protein
MADERIFLHEACVTQFDEISDEWKSLGTNLRDCIFEEIRIVLDTFVSYENDCEVLSALDC